MCEESLVSTNHINHEFKIKMKLHYVLRTFNHCQTSGHFRVLLLVLQNFSQCFSLLVINQSTFDHTINTVYKKCVSVKFYTAQKSQYTTWYIVGHLGLFSAAPGTHTAKKLQYSLGSAANESWNKLPQSGMIEWTPIDIQLLVMWHGVVKKSLS